MANILKRIRKSSLSSSRHEKLLEDSQSAEDPLVEGVTFLVKYLGECGVENDSGEEETATAIKHIITTAKKENSKLSRVSLTVSEKGVKMMEISTMKIKLDISIYSISYCTADPTFDHVFAFICHSPAGGGLSCHTFLCPKRKMAKAATLTIAQGFSLAYQSWQAAQVPARKGREVDTVADQETGMKGNVVVTQAVVEKQPIEQDDLISSPSAGISRSSEQAEDLLIDWATEEESKNKPWDDFKEFETSDSKCSQWIQFDDSESKDMSKQFERLTLGNAPMQILNQLPPNSSSLNFGAFACSPSMSDYTHSPLGSPHYGSSLTHSQLMSPVGSPYQNTFNTASSSTLTGLTMNTITSQLSPPTGSSIRGYQQGQVEQSQ